MRGLQALLLCVASVASQAQSVPSISIIELALAPGQTLPLGDRIAFDIVASDPGKVASALAVRQNTRVTARTERLLSVELDAQRRYVGSSAERYLADTFVIDYNEPSTRVFIEGFEGDAGADASLSQLAAYVAGYIDDPTFIHGFHIASVIATQRSGDCTEYAVLVTALARALGLPARVVVGTVIHELEGDIGAYGHAWAEVWRAGQWHIVDAALYDPDASGGTYYLPAGELENEGPGYTWSLVKVFTHMPQKITRLRAAPQ